MSLRPTWIFAFGLTLAFVQATTLTAAEPEGWLPLFDGKSLNGWKAAEHAESFRVAEGCIVADGPRAHLFYAGDVQQASFQNFELRLEARTNPGANSGVYFHTEFQASGFPGKGHEVQINNSAPQRGAYRENKKTGSLYGIRNQYKSIVADDQWFNLQLVVRGKRVQVRVNDVLLVDYLEPANLLPDPSHPQRHLSRGTFALQCHDPQSQVRFRNLQVRPLPDEDQPTAAPEWDAVDLGLAELARDNYPLVDFHTHLKGGLTLEQALEHMRQTGIFHGVAVNCGVGFPITNDAGVESFLQTTQGKPVFIGMQAEGREWVKLFSPAAVARFDYVFTDSMTIFDHRGQRSRLWIKEEVDIPDAQAFMDKLVQTIEEIFATEPIDIYVNPTYLPAVIADRYDELWTTERTQRVIDAAARKGIAIEISNTHRLPKANFIRRAKQAGVKFTFGTNNAAAELRRLEYCVEMVKECNLTWQDFWIPKPDGQKPVQLRGLPKAR